VQEGEGFFFDDRAHLNELSEDICVEQAPVARLVSVPRSDHLHLDSSLQSFFQLVLDAGDVLHVRLHDSYFVLSCLDHLSHCERYFVFVGPAFFQELRAFVVLFFLFGVPGKIGWRVVDCIISVEITVNFLRRVLVLVVDDIP